MRLGPAIRRSFAAKNAIYAAINIPFMIMQAPAFMILPALYIQHANLGMVLVGTILTALRVLDAVLDPVIGFLSDRTKSRFGRRKPWILAGAVLGGAGTMFAFNPSVSGGYLYFTLAYFFMTLGWTLQEIAHSAWLTELSDDPDERHSLSTWRYNAGMLGTALFPLIPLTPWFKTADMTPEVTAVAAWMVITLLILTVPLMLFLPDGKEGVTEVSTAPLKKIASDLLANRPLLKFVAIIATQGISSGMVSGLYFFYLTTYLGIGNRYSYVMLSVYVLFIVGAWAWLRVSHKIDKPRIIAICTLLTAATNVVMFLIIPGPYAFSYLFGAFSVSAICAAGALSTQNALLADIVDYGTVQRGENHAGNYFAVLTFCNKFTLAAGSGIGFIIAGLFGFNVKGHNGALAMAGFFLAIIWIPFLLNLLSAFIAWRFPLGRRELQSVRDELHARQALAGQSANS